MKARLTIPVSNINNSADYMKKIFISSYPCKISLGKLIIHDKHITTLKNIGSRKLRLALGFYIENGEIKRENGEVEKFEKWSQVQKEIYLNGGLF